MSLRKEVAATVRALRSARGIGYEDLAGVSTRANISALERGKTNITLDKLIELSAALQFDPVALLTISISMQSDQSTEETLERARLHIDAFRADGGDSLLQRQIVGRDLVTRTRGKPGGSKHPKAIKELKSAGFTPVEVMQKLGLSRSTVYSYWNKN